MNKIKISTITIISLLALDLVSLNIYPWWSIFPMLIIGIVAFVILNIEAKKVQLLIGKLVSWIDYLLIPLLAIVLFTDTATESNFFYFLFYYVFRLLFLVIAGLLIAVLVNAYKE